METSRLLLTKLLKSVDNSLLAHNEAEIVLNHGKFAMNTFGLCWYSAPHDGSSASSGSSTL